MSQRDWVLEHIRKYRESNGAEGHIWKGVDGSLNLPCLLLTTTGRKSGTAQTTPLIYGRSGDDVIIVASRGGTPTDPIWYRNLQADPAVELQVGSDRFAATAQTVTGAERSRLWDLMAEIFPSYNDYHEKAKATREIPVVVLKRS
ncbi:MAG: nitroreductase family deazaflavin-dependent oxidoreductase [Rhodospirillaceae bacterium]|jgi:deazaflavin-dependent oxidoreductase (nitroreductase family)|nr:nitroreductase family deazaflavin-dependent oxidoreductase [Rhodospirillaceae bacterium]MBT4487994.1 nitroreductase family deazaflavin-dependent oxidoreductase [Rhodospirillaceae bacterium]MBT5192883.1 nitroreductase family deazaflavin-dependent oxidoreductase [Rhodospirillaceae bacterium]MBT5894752.1 nitroreductase family deazaflavin-dependent oxidoreductase [Rhodospirillaceae bacterium]MBT6426328.1 nitroreductase family deazaflavin-dependent oxidoreductase [Rhodospirillaceae bacterium]